MAQMIETLAGAAGLSPEALIAKIKSGEIDDAAFKALVANLDSS